MNKSVLITGCAGFIGSHVTDEFLLNGYSVIGYDAFTYAGKIENLQGALNSSRFKLVRGSINNGDLLNKLIQENNIEWIINLAAETHVDNSISSCDVFLSTNILGTKQVLDVCRANRTKLLHFSTDEVYGVPPSGVSFTETSPLNPRNPYSASKASADHLIAAYANTYGIEYIMVRPSNNFGPRQHREKFLPKMIENLLAGNKIPVYGVGNQIREWTYVKTTAAAVRFILENSPMNETYNITSGEFMTNIDVVKAVCCILGNDIDGSVEYVPDRLGHDFRYSIDGSKLSSLGFVAEGNFKSRLEETIDETKRMLI